MLSNKSRLITYNELIMNLGCTSNECSNLQYKLVYNRNYWTMSKSGNTVYRTYQYCYPYSCPITDYLLHYLEDFITVRSAINAYKSALETNNKE